MEYQDRIKEELIERRDYATETAERAEQDAATFVMRAERNKEAAKQARERAYEYQQLIDSLTFSPPPPQRQHVSRFGRPPPDELVVVEPIDPYSAR